MLQNVKSMSLVWSESDCRLNYRGVTIVASPHLYPPFPVGAMVEEQDTFLLLGERNELVETDKPAWYLANTLENQRARKPGSIVVTGHLPLKIMAIVHDIEQQPTCSSTSIKETYRSVMHAVNEKNITSLAIPPLGTVHGKISLNESVRLLAASLNQFKPEKLKRIWLIIPAGSNCTCLSQMNQTKKK